MELFLTDWDDFVIAKALVGHFQHSSISHSDNYLYYVSKKEKEDNLQHAYHEVRALKHHVDWPRQLCNNIRVYIQLLVENLSKAKGFLNAPFNPHLYNGILNKLLGGNA